MASLDQADYYSISRLRLNTLIFAGGKGINATLSLSLFALIASNLSKADFAIYAWLIAFVELSNNLSRFGINWAVDRYVPQLRSTLNSMALRRFILIMTSLRLGVVLLMAGVFLALSWLLSRIRIVLFSFLPFSTFLWGLALLLGVGYIGYLRVFGQER